MIRTLLIELAGPLAVFYGLRAAGVSQWIALLAGGAIPAIRAVHSLITTRRLNGVTLFVLATMVLTVAMSFAVGSPRALLVRNAWGTCALGCWILLSLFARRPFLYTGAELLFPAEKQRAWAANWERYPAFRTLLRRISAIWGVLFLFDAALRVVLALSLPVDAVPVLDDVLLALTLIALLGVQRTYGRGYLRRNGLRIEGVAVIPERAGSSARTPASRSHPAG